MDSSFERLRKYLVSTLKGPYINALLKALAYGDDLNEQNILAAKNQIFIATASGQFLEKLLAGIGITKPPGIGIDDDLLREISIKQTNSKLVTNIFLDLLEVFYGSDALRANMISGSPEKYILEDGMTLIIEVDNNPKLLTITFNQSDFTDIGLATAKEIAQAISNSAFAQGYSLTAVAEVDNESHLTHVQLLSGTKGPSSAIKVVGGKANNILLFPQEKDSVPKLGTQFTTSFSGPYVRYTWTAGPDPQLGFVDSGDIVSIYGSGYLANNRGSFEVQNVQGGSVGQSFFEILNPIFKPQSAVTLNGVVGNSGLGTVTRTLSILDVPSGASRTSNVATITTSNPHQLSVGQIVTVEGVRNATFNGTFTLLSVSTNSFTYSQVGENASSGQGNVLHRAALVNPSVGAVRAAGVSTVTTKTAHGYLVGQTVDVEGVEDSSFDGLYTITAITGTTFDYVQNFSNDIKFFNPYQAIIQKLPRYASVYEVNPYEVVIFLPATTRIVKRELIGSWHIHDLPTNKDFLGSYLFDVKSSLPITRFSTKLLENVNRGEIKTVMFGVDTSNFPDHEGYIYLDFGTSNQEGPVKILGRPSSGSLLIDPAYKFKLDHKIGADVTLISGKKAYKPAQDGTDYPTYLTSTIQGRIQAQKLISQITASGIFVNIIIIYPAGPGLADVIGVYGDDVV